MYEKSAKACTGTLESLNLSTMQVETAQNRCTIAQAKLEQQQEGKELELQAPLVVTLRDALALYYKKTESLLKSEKGLQAGTSETEELQQELKALHMELADQTTLPLGTEAPAPAPEQGDLLEADGVDGKGNPPPKASVVQPLAGAGVE